MPDLPERCDCACHMPPVATEPVELIDENGPSLCCDCWETCSACLDWMIYDPVRTTPDGNVCPQCYQDYADHMVRGTFMDYSNRRP